MKAVLRYKGPLPQIIHREFEYSPTDIPRKVPFCVMKLIMDAQLALQRRGKGRFEYEGDGYFPDCWELDREVIQGYAPQTAKDFVHRVTGIKTADIEKIVVAVGHDRVENTGRITTWEYLISFVFDVRYRETKRRKKNILLGLNVYVPFSQTRKYCEDAKFTKRLFNRAGGSQ